MFKQLRPVFGSKPPAPSDPKDGFAAEVEQFLRSVAGVEEVSRAPGEFAFEVVTSAGSRRVFLDNAFAESREMSPEQRRERIALFFSSVGDDEQDETWEAARDTFVPILRRATYAMELCIEQPSAAPIRRPFLPHVDILVAMDRPTSMSLVSRGTIERWNVEDREVFEAGEARVPLLARASVEVYDKTRGPLWIVTSDDSYESSRLLVPGWLASFRGKVEGRPIATIPERATLMVGGDGRAEMVEWLLEKAEREFAASNRRLSPALYTVDEAGAVVPYVRPGTDALATKVKVAHEQLAVYEYGEQKAALDKLYEKEGPDVFVGSYLLVKGASGEPRSISIWTKGARTFLPRTERVMLLVLADAKGEKPRVTVDVPFEAIANRLSAVRDLHPPRFETTGEFPSEQELVLLAARP